MPLQKYRELGNFRRDFPDIPITVSLVCMSYSCDSLTSGQALTASATEEVRNDITDILRIDKIHLAQWVEPFNRKNLFYEVSSTSQGCTLKS